MSSSIESDVKSALTDFVYELADTLDGDAQHIERVLDGEVLSRADILSEPEDWTEDTLINPVIRALQLNKQPGRPNPRYETPEWVDVEIPDFELEEDNTVWIIGENKSVNKYTEAEADLQGYIGKVWWPNEGIATDGITWGAYRVEETSGDTNGDNGQHYRSFSEIVDLRPALQQIAADEGVIGEHNRDGVTDVAQIIHEFVEVFAPDTLVELLRQTAPKQLRDRRKKDVEAFYELYIELLFGKSDEYDYDTHLRDDIIQPDGVTEQDKDIFAVTLVNRLLFIKFLEERVSFLGDGFLSDSVRAYNDGLPGTLYKTVFEPLFFELLNTPLDERPDYQQTGWQGELRYLNGGLFRETVDRELEYDVENRTLPRIINELVEGHELDFELDPAILGSVFEKTINHLSAEGELQKSIGAYYTPDDVTRLINRQTVDQKLRDIIIGSYSEVLTRPNEFQAEVEDVSLEELLLRIEDARGWFGHDEGIELAQERVNKIKVVDPACGSGHFLTAAMGDIHDTQISLHRGLHGGEDPSRQDLYEMKKNLALNAIYGVDIDSVATEIAKLRVWLKIVEDNGWEDGFGELPNIDINIVSGNSLIGLPEKSGGQSVLQAFDLDLTQMESVREEYKAGEISRQELNDRITALRPELDGHYLDRLNHYLEQRIDTRDGWDRISGELDVLYSTIRKITVRRSDGEELSDEQKAQLDDAGFRVEPRYGKSAKVEESDIDNIDQETYADIVGMNNLVFDVERQPVQADLDKLHDADMAYEPFHWVVEFPEVVKRDGGNGYSVEFDVIVGNPPYGDVLTDAEKRFTAGYTTGSINDIVFQFIERELHLLQDGAYFGNIHGMGILYQGNAAAARDLLWNKLENGRIASFGHRPATVFEGANPRAAVTTGRRLESDERQEFKTSDFILFYPEEREEAFRDIEYGSIEGLVLGDFIGDDDGNKSWPKVGSEMSRLILTSLKEDSNRMFRDVMTRSEETDHVVYRARHPLYWINPFMENLYDDHGVDTPQDFEPFYVESDLDRRTAFLLMQSSLFYHYWMTYENQRDLNWGPIEAFPYPDERDLEERRDEIEELSDELWGEMRVQFNGREIPDGSLLKPYADQVDELLGPLLGLDEDQIEWVKQYHTEFGRGAPEDDDLLEYQGEEESEAD